MKRSTIFFCFAGAVVFCLTFSTCVFISTQVKPLDKMTEKIVITSPTKAHLYDGSMVVFPDSFEMTGDVIIGKGIRYDLTREHSTRVESVPRDSVAFLEYYEESEQPGPLLGSLLAPFLVGAAATNEKIHKALFGSCPTVYSFDGDKYSLQAG
ncbi:MAG: hypothetical protein AB1393_05465 [Candidatus Edwardsbacteria bacterium]